VQAEALRARLAGEHFDGIYSSDLSRAAETARIVAEPHGIEVTLDPRLREFSFGAWEGLTWDEIEEANPHLRDSAPTKVQRYCPEGGESFDEVVSRLRAFLDELGTGDRHVAIVSHAGPLHAVLDVLKLSMRDDSGAERVDIRFSPASLTRISLKDGRTRLTMLSDVRHLYSAG
jgi:broad specificity phosphatase PhoE